MKKNLLSLFVIAAVALGQPCCISCSKNPVPPVNPPSGDDPQTEEPELKPGTYTFTASALKGKWEAGDKIYVHGSYGPNAQMITLSASDISDDGRTASAYLDKTTEFPTGADGLYAAYPGEAVIQPKGVTDQITGFSQMDIPLSVAYLSGTDFSFTDASCGLSFKVSGYTDYALAGNQRPGLCFTEYAVEYTSKQKSFSNRTDNGYPFVTGECRDGSATIWFPGNVNLTKGITIYLGKDGKWPSYYTVSKDVNLKIGAVTDLGDITSAIQSYSGPEPKLPLMGKRTEYSVSFNELSGLCLSADEDFLWGVDDNGGLGKISFEGKVLWTKSFGGEFEAITRDPSTGDLLVGEETSPSKVTRIAAPEFTSKSTVCEITGTTGMGNSGLEGLTYYKDGLAYAGMQTGSYLFCFKLNSGEVVWKKNLREIFPVITEIGDLCYDPLTDWLWIIDSESRKFFVLTGDAETLMGSYSVKGIENPEAICIDHKHSCIWVGDDNGKTSYLYRFDFTGLDDAVIVGN